MNKISHLGPPYFQHLFIYPSDIRRCECVTRYMMSHWSVQDLQFLIHHHHWVFIETPLGYPVVLSRGDPEVINQQVQSLGALQQVIDGVAIRVGQPKDVGLDHWESPQARGRVNSPSPMPSRPALVHLWWGMGPSLQGAGVSSPMGQHHQLDAESCQGQGQLSRASEGQDCLSTASDFSLHGSYDPCGNTSHGHQCRSWLLLNNGPRHGRWQQPIRSPMWLYRPPGLSWPLMAMRPLNTNMDTGDSPAPWDWHFLW